MADLSNSVIVKSGISTYIHTTFKKKYIYTHTSIHAYKYIYLYINSIDGVLTNEKAEFDS